MWKACPECGDIQDLQELETAVMEDRKSESDAIGDRVRSWMGKMLLKAQEGLLNVSTGAAGGFLAKAIWEYYKSAPK